MTNEDTVSYSTPLRILIDTNIIIDAEKDDIIKSDVAQLSSFAIENRVIVMIHPASVDDIARDRNLQRKRILESKIKKYPILDDKTIVSAEFIEAVGKPSRPQDVVDDKLLHSVFKNAVNFLVTEDCGIHKKSRRVGLSERILHISDALAMLQRLYGRYAPEHIAINHFEIHNLRSDCTLFDSIKSEYPLFEDWFAKKSMQGRMCWCWKDGDGELQALLIYAEKKKILLRSYPERCLKICTFKVGINARGMKLGELLLKLCFEYCKTNGIASAYITTHEWHLELRLLLEDYGFEIVNRKGHDELVYAKDFASPKSLDGYTPFEYCRRFFPAFYDGTDVRKFVVPIRPEFHDRLLGGSRNKQRVIEEFDGFVTQQNTIKKAYVCKSPTRKIMTGDILLFYRSRKETGITGIGIVESVVVGSETLEDIASIVGVRSVYTKGELERQVGDNSLIILFRHVGQFHKPLRSSDIQREQIMKRPPQTITQLNENQYSTIRDRVISWSIC